MTSEQLMSEMWRLSNEIEGALSRLREAAHEYAVAEHEYRQARSHAWMRTHGTIADREAQVEMRCGDQRHTRDLADNMRTSAMEVLRSRRAQLSALQSLMGAMRAEAEFVRTGPNGRP